MDHILCEEKHKHIEERLDAHARKLGDYDEKLDCLTKSDAVNTNEIKNLCKKLDKLTTALWGVVLAVLTAFGGFILTFIQTLKK